MARRISRTVRDGQTDCSPRTIDIAIMIVSPRANAPANPMTPSRSSTRGLVRRWREVLTRVYFPWVVLQTARPPPAVAGWGPLWTGSVI